MSQKSAHQPIFQKVLDRFKKDLSKKDKDYFINVTSFDDLKRSIGELQATQNDKRRYRNLDRLGPFLEAMRQWGQVVEVFCNSNEIVAFVWVSFWSIICPIIHLSLFLGTDQVYFAGITPEVPFTTFAGNLTSPSHFQSMKTFLMSCSTLITILERIFLFSCNTRNSSAGSLIWFEFYLLFTKTYCTFTVSRYNISTKDVRYTVMRNNKSGKLIDFHVQYFVNSFHRHGRPSRPVSSTLFQTSDETEA